MVVIHLVLYFSKVSLFFDESRRFAPEGPPILGKLGKYKGKIMSNIKKKTVSFIVGKYFPAPRLTLETFLLSGASGSSSKKQSRVSLEARKYYFPTSWLENNFFPSGKNRVMLSPERGMSEKDIKRGFLRGKKA